MLSGLGTLFGVVALIVAALIGKAAVADFRAQKLAGNEIDYSEKILTVAYRLKDALSAIRNPMSLAGELAESEAELTQKGILDGVDKDKSSRLTQANVYFVRARRFDDLFKEAYELMPIAKAYFGDEVSDNLRALLRARQSIMIYAQAYADNHGGSDTDFTKKIHAAIWEGYGEAVEGKDEISGKVDTSIGVLEERLIPIIRPAKTSQSKTVAAVEQTKSKAAPAAAEEKANA